MEALDRSSAHQATKLRAMETDTIGGLKDHLLRTEQAMEAGVTECKQLNRALGDELRDLSLIHI